LKHSLELLDKVRDRTAKICIMGLGHIGLPLSLILAGAGFHVVGVDTDEGKVNRLNQGRCYLEEPGLRQSLAACLGNGTFYADASYEQIGTADYVGMCVPTPAPAGRPDLSYFDRAANAAIAKSHKQMCMLIHSTLPPGSTLRLAAKLGELYKVDKELYVAYCPERLTPGHALQELRENLRIIGGVGPNSTKVAAELFRSVSAKIIETDPSTAELVKLAENTYRDLNIAYANVLAMIAEGAGVDVSEVIRLANSHPRVNIHAPGIGVGGPCLPKDPYLLISGQKPEFAQLIQVARRINDDGPMRTLNAVIEALSASGTVVKNARVAVLGVSYKGDVDDTTDSPAKQIIQELSRMGAHVKVYDPFSQECFGGERAPSLSECVAEADCVIVTTDHSKFRAVSAPMLRKMVGKETIVFDGRRIFDPTQILDAGLNYVAVGFGVPRNIRKQTS
jgi:UDP-N-acetyl-D-mannosaminuronic acid dehydrogenase